jgi:hypothetical protein
MGDPGVRLAVRLTRNHLQHAKNQAYTPLPAPIASARSGRLTYSRIININLFLSSSSVTTTALSRFHARSSRSLCQYQYISTTIGSTIGTAISTTISLKNPGFHTALGTVEIKRWKEIDKYLLSAHLSLRSIS